MPYTHMPLVSSFNVDTVPRQVHEPAGHFEYEMILVTEGSVTATIAHRTYMLTRGSLAFIGRLESHAFLIQKVPYGRYVSILSSDRILSDIRENELLSVFVLRPEGFHHVIQLDGETFDRILPLFEQITREYQEQGTFYVEKCASLLHILLVELYRRRPEAFPRWTNANTQTAVVAAQRYMAENFRRPLTLDEVAEHTFVSRHTLSVMFPKTVGVTFKDYLILLRIAESKRLLVATDLSVREVAEQVGYPNVNNFIKVFRDRVHTTPLQYRLHQNGSSSLTE